MSASPLSVGFAKATGVATPSLNPSSSSIENSSIATSIQFPFKATKPINFSQFNLHSDLVKSAPFTLLSRSLLIRASAAFDGFDAVNITELLDKESGSEDEEQLEEDEEEELEEEEEEEEEGKENYRASAFQSAEARRLYVGNLPFSMTSSQLADIFSECGRVASVEIVYDRVTDRSRGFAFVTMGSYDDAKEAIRLFDGSQVGGRTVKINFPEVPRGGEREVMEPKIKSSYQAFVDSPHKLYAGNLSWGLTSQGLKEVFQDQPGFLSAKVVYDRGTGRSRGFGFITFASAEDADSALDAMNGVVC
ncbi:OLC1v1034047C1 [Oldenlandia corymbosa var. corymbosa]|uniref:OLC1v1034047C1 n=1 Tax=Oldenlandia corymbosa var. corymbosa TaxID=529605 RepID=A0AAV1CQD9_OLDCO|nr:OLC1v1034047C1 [Oldenlandia corymbosa var. corymbosa]